MNEKNVTFNQIRFDGTTLKKPDTFIYPHVSVIIMLDENVKSIVWEVYTFSDVISATGGFSGMIAIIVTILIGRL